MTQQDPVVVMDHLVSLTYQEQLPPNTVRFGKALHEGRILGQKCPSCGRVFVPPKDFCPLCVILLTPDDDVEISDRGVVTGHTVITPVRYYGQTKTEPFVFASVLLDGADGTLGGQDISGIPVDQVRRGQRVKAVWKPPEARDWEGLSARGWGSVAGAISSFTPTGEPDVPKEQFLEHII
jgi:uncharacterized OB-fold protein